MNILISTRFWEKWNPGISLAEAYGFMLEVGADGLQACPSNFEIVKEITQLTRSRRVYESILAWEQSYRSENPKKPIQYLRMMRKGGVMAVLASTIAMPEIHSSLGMISKFMAETNLSRPVQIFPYRDWDRDFPDHQYDVFDDIKDRWLLTQPEHLYHWGVSTADYPEAASDYGFNGIILNTLHLRRRPDMSQMSKDKMQKPMPSFDPWNDTIPILASSGLLKMIEIQPANRDELNALIFPTLEEDASIIKMLKRTASLANRPLIVSLKIRQQYIDEYLEHHPDDNKSRIYRRIINNIRPMF